MVPTISDRRKYRAARLGYACATPTGYQHVLVPRPLVGSVRAMIKGKTLHDSLDRVNGYDFQFLRQAIYLAYGKGLITEAQRKALLQVNKAANLAKHSKASKGGKVLLSLDRLVKRDSLDLSQELACFNAAFGGSDTESEDDALIEQRDGQNFDMDISSVELLRRQGTQKDKNLFSPPPALANGGIGGGLREGLHAFALKDNGSFPSSSDRHQKLGGTALLEDTTRWVDVFDSEAEEEFGDDSNEFCTEDGLHVDEDTLHGTTNLHDNKNLHGGNLHTDGQLPVDGYRKKDSMVHDNDDNEKFEENLQGEKVDNGSCTEDGLHVDEDTLHDTTNLHDNKNLHGGKLHPVVHLPVGGYGKKDSMVHDNDDNEKFEEKVIETSSTAKAASGFLSSPEHIRKDSDTARLGSMEALATMHDEVLHEKTDGILMNNNALGVSFCSEATLRILAKVVNFTNLHEKMCTNKTANIFNLAAGDSSDDHPLDTSPAEPPGFFDFTTKRGFGVRNLLDARDLHDSPLDFGEDELHTKMHDERNLQVHDEVDHVKDRGFVFMMASLEDSTMTECVSLDTLSAIVRLGLGSIYRFCHHKVLIRQTYEGVIRNIRTRHDEKYGELRRQAELWKDRAQTEKKKVHQLGINLDNLLDNVVTNMEETYKTLGIPCTFDGLMNSECDDVFDVLLERINQLQVDKENLQAYNGKLMDKLRSSKYFESLLRSLQQPGFEKAWHADEVEHSSHHSKLPGKFCENSGNSGKTEGLFAAGSGLEPGVHVDATPAPNSRTRRAGKRRIKPSSANRTAGPMGPPCADARSVSRSFCTGVTTSGPSGNSGENERMGTSRTTPGSAENPSCAPLQGNSGHLQSLATCTIAGNSAAKNIMNDC